MPGSGVFGELYPGGFGPEDAGGPAEKTGIGVAGFVASGGDALEHVESGTAVLVATASGQGTAGETYEDTGVAVSSFAASGDDAGTFAESGAGTAPFTASGAAARDVSRFGAGVSEFSVSSSRGIDVSRAGSGVAPLSASGVTTRTYEKAGAGVLVRSADGASAITYTERNVSATFGAPHDGTHAKVASGTNGKEVARTGTAISPFTAKGRQGDAVRGSGVSAFVGSGYKSGGTYNRTGRSIIGISTFSGMSASSRADIVVNRTGFTVRGYAGTGASAITYAETGAAVSGREAAGGTGKSGTASFTLTGAGAGAAEHVESGAGVAPLSASGVGRPGGVAIVQFTGGGSWRDVFANDNFAAREPVDFPTGDPALDAGGRTYGLYGATERATNESGEPRFGVVTTFTNTLWWEYRVPFTCVVRATVLPLDGAAAMDSTGMLHRGAAVNALSDYADPRVHFGQESGRGVDSDLASSPDTWCAFPHLAAVPVNLQMDPSTPLVFNVGKRTSLAANAHRHYRVSLERLLPPSNDHPEDPTVLDLAGGALAWDMAAATGYPGWDWGLLDASIYNPTGRRITADLFWRLAPTEDGVARVRFPSSATASDLQMLVFKGANPGVWEPVELDVEPDYPFAALVGLPLHGFVEFAVAAGESYVIALLQTRSVVNFPPFGVVFMTVTARKSGTIEWELVQRPSNDDFADRLDLGASEPGSTTVADTRGSTAEVGEPEDIQYETAKGVWYEFDAPSSGWYSFETAANLLVIPHLSVYRGTGFSDFEATYDAGVSRPTWLRAGDTYYIRLTAVPNSSTDHEDLSWSLEVPVVAANDDFANRQAISLDTGEAFTDLNGATPEHLEPVAYYTTTTHQPTVWYEWTAPYDMDVKFTLDPPYGRYGEVGVYQGTTLATLVPIARMSGLDLLEIGFHALAGQEYQVQVGYYPFLFDGPVDQFVLGWEPTTLAGNDTFADAITIEGTAGSIASNNMGAVAVPESGTPDPEIEFQGDTRWGRPAWFRHVATVTGTHTFTVTAGSWDGIVALYRGTTLDSLEFVTNGIVDTGWGVQSFDADLVAAETYYLLIVGATYPGGQWDDPRNATWEPDMIPQGTFTLEWAGINTGDDIENADVSFNDLNWYFSQVYGGFDHGADEFLGSGACRVSSNVGATAQVGEPSHGGGFPATRSVWFEWQPGAGGSYEIWVEPVGADPVIDPILAVYPFAGSIGALGGVLASSDNVDGLYPRLTVSLTAFTRYLIAVDARDEGTFEINVRRNPAPASPANDDFANAITIAPDAPVSGTTVGATFECGETPVAGTWGGPYGSVWYTFTPAEDGTYFLSFTADTHPAFAATLVDVYQGSTLTGLTNITPADDFTNGGYDELFGFPISFTGGVPVYIRVSTEADGAFSGDGDGGPFSFELLSQSATPPGNDDFDDASDAPSGGGGGGDTTHPGTTDGAGFEPGEVDPGGNLLEENQPGGGSTWHRYVPNAPGFIAVYVTRDAPRDHWYRVGVWAGETKESSVRVGTLHTSTSTDGPCYYEVRAGETYHIQVIRNNYQTWGAYTLHIDEYLEVVDWELGPDSFTTLHNSPSIAGGVMTCTGRQGVAASREILPQYGALDLGADARKFARETRIGFEVRIVGGQILYRQGLDNFNYFAAFSDDHDDLFMRRLGLVRARDVDGNPFFVLTLAPGDDGNNTLLLDVDSYIRPYPISLGNGASQHDSGWISIEIVVHYQNSQAFNAATMPTCYIRLYVDGRPAFHTSGTTELYARNGNIKQIRYVDVGMWRHPTQSAADEPKYEDPEVWTYDMRNVRVTNVAASDALDVQMKGDLGITEFDGFAPQVSWQKDLVGLGFPARHSYTVSSGSALPVEAFPDKPWGAYRSVNPGVRSTVLYPHQLGSRRFYGFSVNFTEFPETQWFFAGYGVGGYAALSVGPTGELRIRPYLLHDFCVAHLQAGQHYFIEVHMDAEVIWDVRCRVWINGVSFGEYTNATTWSQIGGFSASVNGMPNYHSLAHTEFLLGFSQPDIDHDAHLTNLVVGRSDPATAVGPLQTTMVAAVQTAGVGHHIPEYPTDPTERMELLTADNGNWSTLYGWVEEWLDPGPYGLVKQDGGHNRYYPFTDATENYHPYFVLSPTTAWSEESVGGGNAWSPVGQGRTRIADDVAVTATAGSALLKLTRFGQSVPEADTITGIEVRVHRRASGAVADDVVQLYKGGSLTGANMAGGSWSASWETVTYGGPGEMWGTSWTPTEVNADGFGVGLSVSGSGTAEVDRVSIRVYFDEDGVENRNRWGEHNVIEFFASGDPDTFMHAAGFWEPGGEPGGTRGPQRQLTGTPQQLWGSRFPYWGFGGTRKPSVDWIGGAGGDLATVSDYRALRDPLVYPRHAWSTDDGATWTWITLADEEDSPVIGGDVGNSNDLDAIFLDNNAALDRFEHNITPSPVSSIAMRHPYYYLTYRGESASEVIAANLYVRWRPYAGYPKVAQSSSSFFRAMITASDGSVRRVGNYSGAGLTIARFCVPRDPSGEPWTPAAFNAMMIRLGYNNSRTSGAFTYGNNSNHGAALYAATWELLVSAVPDPPPAPCVLIDLSMTRFIPGGGDTAPATTGIDLSDTRFPAAGGDDAGGGTGVDLSDVLYAPGGSSE